MASVHDRQLRIAESAGSENVSLTSDVTITDTVVGRIHVASGGALVLLGVALDGVVVTGGGYARISGETRSLTVTVGGRATLTGTCHGPVVNDGGEVIIEGVVEGTVISHAGRTFIGPTASVPGP